MTTKDDVRDIRDRAVELERLLDARGAEGKGLGEKYRSLDLSESLQGELRQIVHLRNAALHEGDLSSEDMARYRRLTDKVSAELRRSQSKTSPAASSSSGEGGCLGAALMLLLGVGGLWLIFKFIGFIFAYIAR